MKNLLLSTISLFLFTTMSSQDYSIEFRTEVAQVFNQKYRDKIMNARDKNDIAFLKESEQIKLNFYQMVNIDSVYMLQYINRINNDQEKKAVSSNIAPFGTSTAVRKGKEQLILSHPTLGKEVFSEFPVAKIEWEETNKDSVILGLTVKGIQGTDPAKGLQYKAWYTSQLHPNRGVFDLSHPKGFILAFEAVLQNPDKKTEKITFRAFPNQIKKLSRRKSKQYKKQLTAVTNAGIKTFAEVQALYQEANKKRQALKE